MHSSQDMRPWQQKNVCDGGCTVFMLSSFIQVLYKQHSVWKHSVCVCVSIFLCVREKQGDSRIMWLPLQIFQNKLHITCEAACTSTPTTERLLKNQTFIQISEDVEIKT